jgi:excisionase family DNA binding protein
MNTVQIYTADQAAALLGCSVKTVEEMARQGELPGIKPGGGWVFPAGALAQRLDQLALEQADRRRKPAPPVATTSAQPGVKPRRGSKGRTLPRLVDLGAAG